MPLLLLVLEDKRTLYRPLLLLGHHWAVPWVSICHPREWKGRAVPLPGLLLLREVAEVEGVLLVGRRRTSLLSVP